MRTIRTVILRLFIDSDTPGLLRGSLQPVGASTAVSFRGEQDLLELLNALERSPAQETEPGSPQTGETVGIFGDANPFQ